MQPPTQPAPLPPSESVKKAPAQQQLRWTRSAETPKSVPSELTTSEATSVPFTKESEARMNFIRSAVLHKSLPDLNSPQTRRHHHRCVSGRLRGASTDLGSCSECDTSPAMSRSSSVNLDSSSSSSSTSSRPIAGRASSEARPRPRSAAGERATSDYASRSPSFKYETTSLAQVTFFFWFI